MPCSTERAAALALGVGFALLPQLRAVPGAPDSAGALAPPAAASARPGLSPERCRELALALGEASSRPEAIAELEKAGLFSARPWIDLLEDPELGVRLGALEVLEDQAGTDLGFDPWEEDPDKRHVGIQNWEEWFASGGTSAVPFRLGAPLRPEAVKAYLADILGGDPAKVERALDRMRIHPRQAIAAIEAQLKTLGNSGPGPRARLLEAQYRLLLDSISFDGGRRIARQLSSGTRDERVEALEALSAAPRSVLPLVGAGLHDPDPLVRERAMDTLLAIGGAAVLPQAKTHLEKDPDGNVRHAAIRALGRIKGQASVEMLLPSLQSADEDEVAAALTSLSLLGESSRKVAGPIAGCLTHSSWRVRAGAIQCILKARIPVDDGKLIGLLEDEDSFVRTIAVKAIVTNSGKGGLAKGVEKALVTAVKAHPDLRGPVIRACRDGSQPIPKELLHSLKSASPEDRLAAIPSLSPSSDEERILLEEAAVDPDPDLAHLALRVLARDPDSSPRTRRLVIEALVGESEETREVALSTLVLQGRGGTARSEWTAAVAALRGGDPESAREGEGRAPDTADRLLEGFGLGHPPAATAGSASAASPQDELLESFGLGSTTPEKAAEGAAPAPGDNLADLQSAFLGGDEADPAPSPNSGSKPATVAEALARVASMGPLAAGPGGSRAPLKAALLLLRAGEAAAVADLVAAVPQLSVQDRADLADALERHPRAAFLPLWRLLLRDPAAEVRRRAFRSAFDSDKYPVLVQFVLEEVTSPGHPAEFSDVYSNDLEYLADANGTKRYLSETARNFLTRAEESADRLLALVLLRSSRRDSDLDTLAGFLDRDNPWEKRAAVMAIGRGGRKVLAPRFSSLAADDSVWVREAAAAVFADGLVVWSHRLSETEEIPDKYNYRASDSHLSSPGLLSSRPRSSGLDPEILEGLRLLAADISPRVRLAASMALLSHREEVDVAALDRLLAESPERQRWGGALANFLEHRGQELGPALKPLLNHVDRKALGIRTLERIETLLGEAPEEALALDFSAYLDEAPGSPGSSETSGQAQPQFLEAETGAAPAQGKPSDAVTLLFFHNPGCAECAEVREDLEQLSLRHPDLKVLEFNIRETDSVLLNEALCNRFDVAPQLRQVTPAVFLQEGALVKTGIDRGAIEELIRRTAEVGEVSGWHLSREGEIGAAREEVEERYDALGIAGVFLAGLLDGLNPCAFATIIFLLSYLQVARRSPGEILAVGITFVLAVFLTYFALGLGLVEVVSRLHAFETAGRILNLLLAGGCLWVAVLSFRDARLARHGRLAEMSLQLPTFLKTRIRETIRSGARRPRYLIAAFSAGVVVSVLELACTGQVYLPTIVYGLKSGAAGAARLLLIYNLAFVTPLLVVFVLAWRGLTSEVLLSFQRRHTAAVKTALGLLFLGLGIALLIGSRI